MFLTALLIGCAQASSAPRSALRPDEKADRATHTRVPQQELQQDVQRFSSDFTSRVIQALAPLEESSNAEIATAATRQLLVYVSAALDIATEPTPELALLDMIVFVTLARETAEKHWVPNVFGDDGQELVRMLAQSEVAIWELASKVLTGDQRAQLAHLINMWRASHPDQVHVEGVRLQEFSFVAGRISEAQLQRTQGLLASMRSVTESADQAVLLGNRSIFLANRMPFLLRLQAKVGSREILADAAVQLESAEGILAQAEELRPVVQDLSTMSKHAAVAAREATRLAEAARPLVAERPRVTDDTDAPGLARDNLDRLTSLTEQSGEIVDDLRALAPGGESDVSVRLDGMVRRWIVYLAGAGSFLIVLFWIGYVVAHRLSSRPHPREAATTREEKSPPPGRTLPAH